MLRQVNTRSGWRDGRTMAERAKRWLTAVRLAVVVGAISFGPGINPTLADSTHAQPAIDEVSVFASAPAPGHPFGVAVGDGRVYVSTSVGDFFTDPANGGHRNSDGERIFTYNEGGKLVDTTTIPTMPNATMGLFGLALDGNPKPNHGLYVADMNGRILRVDLSKESAAPEVFSQVPLDSGLSGDWMKSMWNDLVFDRAGNLYVPDDKPRIWRVGPDGTPSIWFTDPRLTGAFGIAGGPLGGRIDPTGQWLYFTITVSAEFPFEAVLYRIRLTDHPTAPDLELVHRFPVVAGQAPPQATGLAFAKSGNIYVSLTGVNQIAVLDPAGNETRRISSPLFYSPWGLAFLGDSLLVTNADIEPGDNPAAWKIFKVLVGEPGLPLNRPRLPRD